MTKQEMRRLGLLPYQEDEPQWVGRRRRRRRTPDGEFIGTIMDGAFTVHRQEVTTGTRRLRAEWRMEPAEELEIMHSPEAIEQIAREIDQEIIDRINSEVQGQQIVIRDDEHLAEEFGQPDIHPNRFEEEPSFALRAWRNFIARFNR